MSDQSDLNRLLAAATCALLGSGAAHASEADSWNVDSALLYYGEDKSRVQDVSARVDATRKFEDERALNLSITADTLTGASANGAIATGTPQTFTSPSGRATYATAANEIPLDDTFHDTRFAMNASWSQPFAELYSFSAGLGFSTEFDYQHLGGDVSIARDFNKRNTTLSVGIAYSNDSISPVGGAPIGLSQMLDVGDNSNKLGNDKKNVVDLLFGFSQVLNRTTVLRLNYSYSQSSGYLNDPYKVLSVVDPVTGDTITRLPSGEGPSGMYLYENRPDTRTKQSVYGELKHAFGKQVLEVGVRYMTDDWGINSETIDGRFRWPLSGGYFVEPHMRYYTQTAADFYRFDLIDGQPLPQFASADYRLGKFEAATLGLKVGHETAQGNEWNARLEYYQQNGKVSQSDLIGNQLQRDNAPDLKAVIFQVGYRFGRR
ncbi:MAG TPA: DUF3570 domain-containing protein [Steroidobacteraceae bacterium]|nr:DUF3570 domain-containing protein [Steroidobacteraceae bacterium]